MKSDRPLTVTPSILICITSLGLGGAEDIIVRLANGLSENAALKLRVLLRCDEDRSRVRMLAARVDFDSLIPGSRSQRSVEYRLLNLLLYIGSPLLAVWSFFAFRVSSFQSVHVNLTQFSLYSIFWRALCQLGNRPRFIQTFHTNLHLLRNWQQRIFIRSWKSMDCVVVEIDESEVYKVGQHIPRDMIRFVPFAVEHDLSYIDRKGNPAPEVLRLGSLARLRLFEKKYDAILEGLRILKESGVKFEYLIGGDGPDREEIQQLVALNGLTAEVRMLGVVERRAEFFKSIDLMIVATVGYDTGIAGLQALAAGVPLIGYNTKIDMPPAKDTGMLLACAPQELSEALQTIVATNLYEYWQALCIERQAQIGDTAMIDSYSKLMLAPSDRCVSNAPAPT